MGIAIFMKTVTGYDETAKIQFIYWLDVYIDKENEATYKQIYSEIFLATVVTLSLLIPFVGVILQPFQFDPVFTAAERQARTDLAGTLKLFYFCI